MFSRRHGLPCPQSGRWPKDALPQGPGLPGLREGRRRDFAHLRDANLRLLHALQPLVVLSPESDGDLPAFMQQMTNMHVKRWQEHRREIGYGHLYQGRYKCFPVETEDYFYQVVRYVERNALRANLVACAEQWPWPWSSLCRGERGEPTFPILSPWPLPRPANWLEIVNCAQSEAELDALRRCVRRGRPFGNADWTARTAKQLGIESTLRARGRPKKEREDPK
jgi:putative transposase